MSAKRDPIERMRQTMSRHFDGVDLSLENASVLFSAAHSVVPTSAAHATYLASMGAEELGKALLLAQRARDLILNAEIRVRASAPLGSGNVPPGKLQPRSIASWGVFAGRRGTHGGGLHDHAAKLQALRDDYARRHDVILESSPGRIVLASIDVFAGANAASVRQSIEKSVYVSWSGRDSVWRSPLPCINQPLEFLAAMDAHSVELSERLHGLRARCARRLDYAADRAKRCGAKLSEIFPADS